MQSYIPLHIYLLISLELLSVMMNNTSRSVAESDTGDMGVNTGRGLGAGADTTNVPDVTKVCSSGSCSLFIFF